MGVLPMVYLGKVKDGRIELDPSVRLPEGAVVRVEAVENGTISKGASSGPAHDPADHLFEEAVDMRVDDLAAEHDHYLHGTPKRVR